MVENSNESDILEALYDQVAPDVLVFKGSQDEQHKMAIEDLISTSDGLMKTCRAHSVPSRYFNLQSGSQPLFSQLFPIIINVYISLKQK